jgi:undecaprenyl-diphosphatase
MKFFTFLGGEIFLTSGILLLLALLYKRHKVSSFNFTVLLVLGTIINLLLKFVFQRPRPDYLPLMFESTYSFPSGHAMNSFIFYSCIAYFIFRNTKSVGVRIFAGVLLSILVLMIGISRIYLGVHYPSDVLAGYIAGILWFLLIVFIEKTASKFKLFKKSS